MKQRYFQWLVGDMAGEVEALSDIRVEDGEEFFDFASGECCNAIYISPATNDPKDLRNKAMVEVSSVRDVWKFEEVKTGVFTTAEDRKVQVPPLEDILNAHGQSCDLDSTVLGTKRPVAPKNNLMAGTPLPKYDDFHKANPSNAVKEHINDSANLFFKISETNTDIRENVPEVAKTAKKEESTSILSNPVHILIDSCKKHDTEIPVTVTLSLPSREIYNIVSSEFEDGAELFISYIAEKIDTTEIVESLKRGLRSAYLPEE